MVLFLLFVFLSPVLSCDVVGEAGEEDSDWRGKSQASSNSQDLD
jgi:hypothetical protein